MEIVRIGDSAPEPLPAGDRPLVGIRVLDLTRVLAGPTCARTLAEHGADVMKITAAHLPNLGYQEWDTGHGKLSAHLDLRAPGDVETLRGLVREADVFSQGYRPGTLAGREACRPRNWLRCGRGWSTSRSAPSAMPARGRRGRGFDTVVQTVSGITARQAEIVPGEDRGAAILSGVGDRLLHRLLDGVRRDGGPGAPCAGRRQLAGAHIAGPGRQVDGRSRRSAGRVARRMCPPSSARTSWSVGRW